jgi:hypothetical protein
MQNSLSNLERIESGHQYWIGDALLFARDKFGESFAQMVPAGKEETWKQYMWVASRVPNQIRDLLPTYTHARVLASLDFNKINDFVEAQDNLSVSVNDFKGLVKEFKSPAIDIKPDEKEEVTQVTKPSSSPNEPVGFNIEIDDRVLMVTIDFQKNNAEIEDSYTGHKLNAYFQAGSIDTVSFNSK